MRKLENKIAVITGSTSGIGEGIARKLASEGAVVIVSGRNLDKGQTIVNSINENRNSAKFISCDTSCESDIKNLIELVISEFGKLDILINNAGLFFTGNLSELESDKWDEMYKINVKGYYLMSKYAMPHLIKSGTGVILNNASVAGLHSYASGQSYAYSSSKAAVIQLSRILALNYGKDGVRVNTICPGIIQTPIFDGRDISASKEKIPIGRVGTVEEVASIACFLVSTEASYITGAVIPVDGGLSI